MKFDSKIPLDITNSFYNLKEQYIIEQDNKNPCWFENIIYIYRYFKKGILTSVWTEKSGFD